GNPARQELVGSGAAVNHDRSIDLLYRGDGFFNQKPSGLFAARAGLTGGEHLADEFFGSGFDAIGGCSKTDGAGIQPVGAENLSFDRIAGASQLDGGPTGICSNINDTSARDRDCVAVEQFLRLKLVQSHWTIRASCSIQPAGQQSQSGGYGYQPLRHSGRFAGPESLEAGQR